MAAVNSGLSVVFPLMCMKDLIRCDMKFNEDETSRLRQIEECDQVFLNEDG